jgi:hypothetical protein
MEEFIKKLRERIGEQQGKISHRSFGLVDHKVAEAEFFLIKLRGSGFDFFAARCYASAFVAAPRSITFSLQAVLGKVDGFAPWYAEEQKQLGANPTAKFFHRFRTVSQHIGENLVSGGSSGPGRTPTFCFLPTPDVTEVPSEDVFTACEGYFRVLLGIVFDCYVQFGPLIDAHQRYTEECYTSIGKTIEDAEEDFGIPRGWTRFGDSTSLPYRWQLLRDQSAGCEINQLFETYLGKTTPRPDRLPPFVPSKGDDR